MGRWVGKEVGELGRSTCGLGKGVSQMGSVMGRWVNYGWTCLMLRSDALNLSSSELSKALNVELRGFRISASIPISANLAAAPPLLRIGAFLSPLRCSSYM